MDIKKSYPIAHVSKEDLEEIGFNTANLPEDKMTQLASDLQDLYITLAFWEDLETVAEHLEIPRYKNPSHVKLFGHDKL